MTLVDVVPARAVRTPDGDGTLFAESRDEERTTRSWVRFPDRTVMEYDPRVLTVEQPETR